MNEQPLALRLADNLAADDSLTSICDDAAAELRRLHAVEKERDRQRTELEQWSATLWAVARELNCLPSTYSDGNAHVLKAAIKLRADVEALRADAERYRHIARINSWDEREEAEIDAARGQT